MFSIVLSRLIILFFGTLYPAYASYKAVKTRNIKEYLKWMMYWIVFALFTCMETFTDVFLSWFPFYYEIKIITVLWLLSPVTKGSSFLYRKFVHPWLSRREQEIDEYIEKAKEQSYSTVLTMGTKGMNYATSVLMQTAIRSGGGLVNQLKKSYSLSDLIDDKDLNDNSKVKNVTRVTFDDAVKTIKKNHAEKSEKVEMYFPEVNTRKIGIERSVKSDETRLTEAQIRSSDDISYSSGYSSAAEINNSQMSTSLTRVGSLGSTRSRARIVKGVSGGQAKRPASISEDDLITIPKSTFLYLLRDDDIDSESIETFFDVECDKLPKKKRQAPLPPRVRIDNDVQNDTIKSTLTVNTAISSEKLTKKKLNIAKMFKFWGGKKMTTSLGDFRIVDNGKLHRNSLKNTIITGVAPIISTISLGKSFDDRKISKSCENVHF